MTNRLWNISNISTIPILCSSNKGKTFNFGVSVFSENIYMYMSPNFMEKNNVLERCNNKKSQINEII
jgi:hypothetical protein